MFRMLSQVFSVRIHRPDVHGAVTVRRRIDALVPYLLPSRSPRIILRQRDSFTTGRKSPDVLCRPTLISFGRTSLKRKPGEEERFATRIEIAFASLPQRDDFLLSIERQRHELRVRQGRIAISAIEYAAVTRPTGNQHSAPVPGAPHRHPSIDRDGVDLRRAFILSGKSNGLSVRGNRRICLLARVRSQPPRGTTLDRNDPEIAFRGKNNGLLMDRWISIITGAWLGNGHCDKRHQT